MGRTSELLDSLDAAVEKVKSKGLVLEQTKAAFEAASQDHQDARSELASIQQQLNDVLGPLVSSDRVRSY